jgi:hypothetical protein
MLPRLIEELAKARGRKLQDLFRIISQLRAGFDRE